MGALTTTLAAALARPNVIPGLSDTVYRNDGLIPLFRQTVSVGNSGKDIKCITAANTSAELYSENDAAPARGYQQTLTVNFAFKHIRVLFGLTGHARRYLGSNWQASYADGFDVELNKAVEDLRDLATTTFLGTQIYGLEGIVDSTTAFGNQSRSTYTSLKSYELSGASASISTSLLNKWLHNAKDAPYGGDVELVLISPTQGGKWGAAQSTQGVGGAPVGGALIPATLGADGRILVHEIADLTNSVAVGLTGVDRYWDYWVNEDSPGGLHIKEYGAADDSDTIQVSTAGALTCTAPQRQTKLTTLTTA